MSSPGRAGGDSGAKEISGDLPVSVDNTELSGLMDWFCIRQLPIFLNCHNLNNADISDGPPPRREGGANRNETGSSVSLSAFSSEKQAQNHHIVLKIRKYFIDDRLPTKAFLY